MTPQKPPNAPPPAAKQADADWDDVLGEAKQSGISPEMARALLSMNPKLREEGKNTAWVVSSGQKAVHQGAVQQQQQAAKPGAKQAGPGGHDAFTEIDARKKKLEEEDKRVEAEIKALQDGRARAKQETLDGIMRFFAERDPELLSPMTQQALADNKVFLEKLGFSVKVFVEFKRKLGKK